MRKLFHFIWTLVIIGIFCTFATAEEKKAPRLMIKNPIFDAGTVNEGEIIKHTFLFRNLGDAALEIRNVKPG